MSIVKSISWKHLRLILEANLTIDDHINDKNGNHMNAIGLLRKPLYFFTSFKSAVSTSFIRLHFNYGDVTYDQHSNATFCSKNESVQYNVVLAITKDSIRNQNQNINIPGLKEKTTKSHKVLWNKVPKHTNEILFQPILRRVGGESEGGASVPSPCWSILNCAKTIKLEFEPFSRFIKTIWTHFSKVSSFWTFQNPCF